MQEQIQGESSGGSENRINWRVLSPSLIPLDLPHLEKILDMHICVHDELVRVWLGKFLSEKWGNWKDLFPVLPALALEPPPSNKTLPPPPETHFSRKWMNGGQELLSPPTKTVWSLVTFYEHNGSKCRRQVICCCVLVQTRFSAYHSQSALV